MITFQLHVCSPTRVSDTAVCYVNGVYFVIWAARGYITASACIIHAVSRIDPRSYRSEVLFIPDALVMSFTFSQVLIRLT